jgi:putative ABC transport system permease protein
MPFYLCFKYIQRGKVWTLLLTSFMMMVAFINAIFVPSLFNGVITGTNNQIINTFSGNIYVAPQDGEDYIDNIKNNIDKIQDMEGILAASPRTTIPGQLEYKNIHGNWQILAIDPALEKKVTNVSDNMMSGQYLQNDDEDGMIIGRQIAGGAGVEENAFSFKGAKVGDPVSIILNGNKIEFKIQGIFYTKFLESDKRAFISKKALERLIPESSNKATMISIKTDRGADENALIENVKSTGVSNNVYKWDEIAGTMKAVGSSFTSINVIMSLVAILIAAITVFIVIYVDIVNKRKQIGILRAIGIKPYIIVFSYVILSAVYSVIGVLLGTAVFFFVLVPYFNAHPFVLPICDAVLDLKYVDYLARSEAIMWVSVFSGLIPSLIIVRTKMLDAILGK